MIYLNKQPGCPLYLQIYNQLKSDILSGTLKKGQVLAGSRSLARTLGVSRNTVDNAYSQLLAEGYISPQQGIGYLVLDVPELGSRHNPSAPAIESAAHPVRSPLPPANKVLIRYDLTNSSQTSDLFPKRLWRRYTQECLDRLEQEEKMSSSQDKQGDLYLRKNLLSYLQRIRGVHCTEDQIIITAGIQQSLDYLSKLLPAEKSVTAKTILMEEPGFNKAAAVFDNNNLRIQPAAVDENGLITSRLPLETDAAAIYTTPSHQFPTGATLSVGRRYELLTWAKQHKVYIIEDDFDSEQRYYAKPLPSLQSIDSNDLVIYLGTFSKALSPSLRMGYMILPPLLLQLYHQKFALYNSTVPLLNQYVIARLIETEQYDRHIRRLNNIFRRRLERFTQELLPLGSKVKMSGNSSGQYFLLTFSQETDQQELIDQALAHGVRVYPTMQFWQEKADCPPNSLFLGFSQIKLDDIADCVTRLKTAWAKWL